MNTSIAAVNEHFQNTASTVKDKLNSTVAAVMAHLDQYNVSSFNITLLMTEKGPLGKPLWYTAAAIGGFLLLCCIISCVAHGVHRDDSRDFAPAGICERRPTDIPCLAVFLIFVYGMVVVVHYAYLNGEPKRLTHGFDYSGHLCGVDADVSDKPFLFWCPSASDSFDFQNPANYESVAGAPVPINFDKPICVTTCPRGQQSALCPQPSQANMTMQGVGAEAITITTIATQMMWKPTYLSKPLMGIYCVPDAPPDSAIMQLILQQTNINGPLQQGFRAIGSLRRGYSILLYAAAAAVVFSILYIVLLSCCAKCLMYTTLLLAILVLAVASVLFLVTAYHQDDPDDSAAIVPHKEAITHIVNILHSYLDKMNISNPMFDAFSKAQAVKLSYGVGGVLSCILLLTLCVLCCCHHKLDVAAALVDTAADCMLAMWSLMFEAIIDMVFRCGLVFALAYGLFWVVSCGDVQADHGASIGGTQVTGMTRSLTFTTDQKYMIAYYIFGSFWLLELAHAVGQFTISYMVVLWYYTPKDGSDKKAAPHLALFRAYFAAFFCHLGTLAIGSFSIACARMAKVILGGLSAHAKGSGNKVMECAAKGLGCIVECFQNCMEFIDKNAYIDVAINSNNFCMAAKHAFEFMFQHPGEIVLLNGSCLIFQVIGVLTVMGLTGAGSYGAVTHMSKYTSEDSETYVNTPVLVAIVAAGIGGLIAMVFMIVFDQTADTLLYTYTWSKAKGSSRAAKTYAPRALLDLDNGGRDGYTALPARR
jgi:hypothetical protein